MTTKAELIATCQALRHNDPRHTQLDLTDYDALLLDQKHVQQVVQALEENTVVEDLTLSSHLCAYSALQLSHFLRSSPSLHRLRMNGKGQVTEEVARENESLKTSIAIKSISHSSSLVKLTLSNTSFGENCPLEGFLSSTRTLLDFSYFQNSSAMPHGVGIPELRNVADRKKTDEIRRTRPSYADAVTGASR